MGCSNPLVSLWHCKAKRLRKAREHAKREVDFAQEHLADTILDLPADKVDAMEEAWQAGDGSQYRPDPAKITSMYLPSPLSMYVLTGPDFSRRRLVPVPTRAKCLEALRATEILGNEDRHVQGDSISAVMLINDSLRIVVDQYVRVLILIS